MVYRLRNQSDPDYILNITKETWFRILELAENYGWNPIGFYPLEQWEEVHYARAGYYLGSPLGGHDHRSNGDGRLMMLEDALNLADALDQAFMEYEPARVPASFFVFEPQDPNHDLPPAIGTLSLLIDFCRSGAFWVENYLRHNS